MDCGLYQVYFTERDGLKFVWGNETLGVSIPVDAKSRERKMCQIIAFYFHLNSNFSFRNVKVVSCVICSKFNRPSLSSSASLELEGGQRLN